MGGAEEEQGQEQESPSEADPRARLLGERVVRSLRVERDRWTRCGESPEARLLLRGFLEGDPARRLLLVTLSAGGQLALAERLPLAAAAGRAGKGVFLLRAAPGYLLCGDLAAAALDHLATLLEEVGRSKGRGGRGGRSRRRIVRVGCYWQVRCGVWVSWRVMHRTVPWDLLLPFCPSCGYCLWLVVLLVC